MGDWGARSAHSATARRFWRCGEVAAVLGAKDLQWHEKKVWAISSGRKADVWLEYVKPKFHG